MSNRSKHVAADKIAKQIRELYKEQGLPEESAFVAIGDMYRGLGGDPSPSKSGLVTMSEVDYPPIPQDQAMHKAPAKRKKAKHVNGKAPRPNGRTGLRFTRFSLPEGDGWAARVARGLVRWREKNELTVPVAAEKYGVDLTAWYRVERGMHVATTGQHIDHICEAIGLDIVDILTLGKS
jgi:hypothetical protein